MKNNEIYEIPYTSIQFLRLDGINDTFYIKGDKGNCFHDKRADSILLVIKDIKNIKPTYDFSSPFLSRVCTNGDIQTMVLSYENKQEQEFEVPWNPNNEEYNSWQIVSQRKDGATSIKIVRRKR